MRSWTLCRSPHRKNNSRWLRPALPWSRWLMKPANLATSNEKQMRQIQARTCRHAQKNSVTPPDTLAPTTRLNHLAGGFLPLPQAFNQRYIMARADGEARAYHGYSMQAAREQWEVIPVALQHDNMWKAKSPDDMSCSNARGTRCAEANRKIKRHPRCILFARRTANRPVPPTARSYTPSRRKVLRTQDGGFDDNAMEDTQRRQRRQFRRRSTNYTIHQRLASHPHQRPCRARGPTTAKPRNLERWCPMPPTTKETVPQCGLSMSMANVEMGHSCQKRLRVAHERCATETTPNRFVTHMQTRKILRCMPTMSLHAYSYGAWQADHQISDR